jgi:hypothetical protein
MNSNTSDKYPRRLSERETGWLFYLLPEEIPAYAEYRTRLSSMLVIGEGRFGEGNLVLGYEGDKPDLSYSSLPVFACGQIEFKECRLQISIHELFDNKIEISISNISGEKIPDSLKEVSRWSYSYWKPGAASPFEGDELREIDIAKTKGALVLALSPKNYSLWLYEAKTGLNHIVPVTNFINELLRGNTTVDKSRGINIAYVFENHKQFSDDEFIKALVQYNKQWRKAELLDSDAVLAEEKKGLFGKMFNR